MLAPAMHVLLDALTAGCSSVGVPICGIVLTATQQLVDYILLDSDIYFSFFPKEFWFIILL